MLIRLLPAPPCAEKRAIGFYHQMMNLPLWMFSYVDFSKQIISDAFLMSAVSIFLGFLLKNGIRDFWNWKLYTNKESKMCKVLILFNCQAPKSDICMLVMSPLLYVKQTECFAECHPGQTNNLLQYSLNTCINSSTFPKSSFVWLLGFSNAAERACP